MARAIRARPPSASRAAPVPARPPVQAKLRIGPVDDPLEREADRVADAVVRGESAGPVGRAPSAAQRMCAGCDDEELPVQRKCASCASAETGHASGEAAARAVSGGGAPLSPDLRAYFEPRFGRDLSSVRVHTDFRAGRAADAISARAFTVGDHVAFAAGEYAPYRADGRRLIAHELAHTIQQAPFVARQFHRHRFPERAGGGTTDFEETVQVQPTAGRGGFVGTVDRRVIAPASGSQAQQVVHTGRVRNIRFTPDCNLIVPYQIRFVQQRTARAPICQNPPNATAVPSLPAAQVNAIGARYVRALNDGLNGWYSVVVSGCDQPCTNQPIPIRVEVAQVTTGGDRAVNVVNRGGRGDAGTICAGDFSEGFAVHEGGHQVLGAGDEYLERDPTILQRVPQWGRRERVRTDPTYMGSHSAYGRFAQFHERHFRFAQAFLEAVYAGQGCQVSLRQERDPPADVRLDFGVGGVAGSGGEFLSLSAMVGFGIPLERQRRAMLEMGLLGQWFTLGSRERDAYLLGLRAGVELRMSPTGFGVGGTLFGSAGVLHRPEETRGLTTLPARTSGYGEGGLRFGLHTPMSEGFNLRVGVEAALGTEITGDPAALRWFRAGFTIGGSF